MKLLVILLVFSVFLISVGRGQELPYLVDTSEFHQLTAFERSLIRETVPIINEAQNDTTKALLVHRMYEKFEDNDVWILYLGYLWTIINKNNFRAKYPEKYIMYEATYYNDYAYYFWYKGQLDMALDYYIKAVDMMGDIGAKNSVGNILCNIGEVYNILGNKDKTLEYYNKSLAVYKEINNTHLVTKMLDYLGRINQTMGRMDEAMEYFLKSKKISEETGDTISLATTLSNAGYLYAIQGDLSMALKYHHKSLQMRNDIGDIQGEAESLMNLAYIYKKQGNVPMALKHLHEALKINEDNDYADAQAICLNMIGTIHFSYKDDIKAATYFNAAINIMEQRGDKEGQATPYGNLGSIYQRQGDFKKALEHFNEVLSIEEQFGEKRGMASALNYLGDVNFDQGKIEMARTQFNRALLFYREIGDKTGISSSLYHVATTYKKQGNSVTAKIYAKNSLKLARELGYPLHIESASKLLTKIYKEENNYQKALEMYELHIEMRDSIHNEQSEKAVIKQQMKYEYDKKAAADSIKSAEQKKVLDAQILTQEAKLSQEKTFKNALYGGISLVILFSFFVINRLRITKKQKVEIELKNTVLNERNIEIAHQKELVEHKNKEILDSITYAEKIQSAILPPIKLVKEYLPQSFILYKPKDIVAGDFYWLEAIDDNIYFAAADCTGHGVPGAMMSVMCSNALTRCAKELGLSKPSEILNETHKIIESRFERSEQTVLDGMDLALCKLNLKTKELEYAGANNPLWIMRNDEILETKADKQPIGWYYDRIPFTNHTFQLQEKDIVYVFTDGYIDQFGGKRGKKFKKKPFKELLLSIKEDPLDKQGERIAEAFDEWKGELEQIDDVCVLGVKI